MARSRAWLQMSGPRRVRGEKRGRSRPRPAAVRERGATHLPVSGGRSWRRARATSRESRCSSAARGWRAPCTARHGTAAEACQRVERLVGRVSGSGRAQKRATKLTWAVDFRGGELFEYSCGCARVAGGRGGCGRRNDAIRGDVAAANTAPVLRTHPSPRSPERARGTHTATEYLPQSSLPVASPARRLSERDPRSTPARDEDPTTETTESRPLALASRGPE